MTLWGVEGHVPPVFDFGEYLDGLYGYAFVLSRNSADRTWYRKLAFVRFEQQEDCVPTVM